MASNRPCNVGPGEELLSNSGPIHVSLAEPECGHGRGEAVAPHTSRTYREWDGEVRFLRADFPVVDAMAEELGIPKDWQFGSAEGVRNFAKRAEQFRPVYYTPEEIADMIRRGVFRFDRLDVAEWDASTGTFKLQRFP